MDNPKPTPVEQGAQLNTLAGLLFSEASTKWYAAAEIELVVGIASAIFLLVDLPQPTAWAFATGGFIAYVTAYWLRLRAETQHAHAETMRRQSVLSEALDWELSQSQLTEWRRRSGQRALTRLEVTTRDPDYYATRSTDPSERLSHMTSESAFYSRHLYGALSQLLWWVSGVAIVVTMIALSAAFLVGDRAAELSSVVLSILTVLISADVIGWAFRLQGMKNDIFEIERDFERMGKSEDRKLEYVMRLVGEYNCVVVGGIPILSWWFQRHHDAINREWREYIKGSGGLPG